MSICCNSSKIDALLEPQDYIILNFRLSRLRKLCLSMFYSFHAWDPDIPVIVSIRVSTALTEAFLSTFTISLLFTVRLII
jgi:hypothetical protein